jgi:DNA adenine methylase
VKRLTDYLPHDFGDYYEPMLGSGALFFFHKPAVAHLSDINPELMNFYRVLQNSPGPLQALLSSYSVDKNSYYAMRGSTPRSILERAARFYYLIRLSWNGLYRVNRSGDFNVPFGGRTPKDLFPLETAWRTSRLLRDAHLSCGDFEKTCLAAKPGDLVYFDPPYPKGACNGNGFSRYDATGFTLDDHSRLARLAGVLADRGVQVLITETSRRNVLRMYPRGFVVRLIRNHSLIAADSNRRRQVYEAVLTSYPPPRKLKA